MRVVFGKNGRHRYFFTAKICINEKVYYCKKNIFYADIGSYLFYGMFKAKTKRRAEFGIVCHDRRDDIFREQPGKQAPS